MQLYHEQQLTIEQLRAIAQYLRHMASISREAAENWDRFQEYKQVAEANRRLADRKENLAEAAEKGPWPPEGAHLCILCAYGHDPEEGRCPECAKEDCCFPHLDGAQNCEVCGETYCPHCLRWVPNCQRGLYGGFLPPWEEFLRI
jgi:hypothetical protein